MTKRTRQNGFSLIEIVVVMLMVGLIFSVATISFGDRSANKQLRKVTDEIVTIADHLREVAIGTGVPVGMLLEPPAWRESEEIDPTWKISWYKLETLTVEIPIDPNAVSQTAGALVPQTREVDTWVAIEGVRESEITSDILIELKIEKEVWEYDDEPPLEVLPQLVFYPTGEVSQFSIELTHSENSELLETVTVDEWGDIIWKEEEEIKAQLEEGF